MQNRRVYVRRQGRTTAAQARGLVNLDAYLLQDESIETNFGREGPLLVEIGFGNGLALAEFAAQNSEWNCIGVEVYRSGMGSLVNHCLRDGLTNIRIVDGEGLTFLESLSDRSIDQIWVLFPDPWPKRRHADRRLISQEFGEVAATKLKSNGKLIIATDWQEYAESIEENMKGVATLVGGKTKCPEIHQATKYERRGIRLGHEITKFKYDPVI